LIAHGKLVPFLLKLPAYLTLFGRRKGSFTLTATSFDKLTTPPSRKRKRSFTLTPTLSPQGRGRLLGRYPRREREITVVIS